LTPLSADAIRHHLAYNAWANQRLLEAVAPLTPELRSRDFGSAYKSIQGTLTHCLRAERSWLRRIDQGAAEHLFSAADEEGWDALVAEWLRIQQAWRDWAASLSDSDASRVIDYKDLKDNTWSNSLWQIVLHVVNHSTHHRGQVSAFLRASQIGPPTLDFIAFVRQNSGR